MFKYGQSNKLAKAYLRGAIASFEVDPASTSYQAGYLAALKEALKWIEANE